MDTNEMMLGDIEDITDPGTQRKEKQPKIKKIKQQKHKEKMEILEKQQQEEQQNKKEITEHVYNGNPADSKVFVKTYGCSHNMSDSEFMMGQLQNYGFQLVNNLDESDLVVINSCTVKNPSQDAIVNLVTKAKDVGKKCVVAGCVPQGDRSIKEFNEASAIGVQQIDRVVEVVEETLKGNQVRLFGTAGSRKLPSLDLPKIRKNNLIEIIPINAGCLGSCTYCKTKHARGKLLSYQPQELVDRVLQASKEGVKEIWLTSEDTGAYGRDIDTDIAQLLKQLVEVLPEDVIMRVGMTNPPYILEHLENIVQILNHPRVYAFLHIPVQAANDQVLEKMNREYTVEDFEKVCDYLLKYVPDMTIATDIICGFPGETNEQFDDTLKCIEKYKFPWVNISQFYPRPGTAAMRMKKCNSKDVKARSQAITKLFESYNKNKYQGLIGQERRIYINEKEERKGIQQLIGHTKNYTKVIIPYDAELLGKQVIVKITKAFDWHVEGDIIERYPAPAEIPQDYFKDYKISKSSNTMNRKVRSILRTQQLEEKEQQKLQQNQFQSQDACGSGGCGDGGCGDGGCGTSSSGGGCGSCGTDGGCGSCSGECNVEGQACEGCGCGKADFLEEDKTVKKLQEELQTLKQKQQDILSQTKNQGVIKEYGIIIIALLLLYCGFMMQ